MMTVMERRSRLVPRIAAAVANSAPVAGLDLTCEFLSFRVGDEEYAIDILKVQEIRSYEVPTRLAGAPELVKGVLNLRGDIIPVIDLRARLGAQPGVEDLHSATIVLSLHDRTIGAVVDSVSDVVALGPADLKAPPTFGGAVEAVTSRRLARLSRAPPNAC